MRISLRLIILWSFLLLMAACQGDSEALPTRVPIPTDPPATASLPPTETVTPRPPTSTPRPIPRTNAQNAQDQAYIRVLHAAYDQPAVSVFIDGLPLAFNMSFGLKTQVAGIEAGEYAFLVLPQGSRPGSDVVPLMEKPLLIAGGQTMTVILTATDSGLDFLTHVEDFSALRAGETRLTAIHLIDEVPTSVAIKHGESLLPVDLPYGGVSSSNVVPSGEALIAFETDGTKLVDATMDWRPRTSYTVVAIGSLQNLDSLSMVTFADSVPGRFVLRYINATEPEVGALDFYLDGLPVAQAIDPSRAGERHEYDSGIHTFAVYAAGANPAEDTAVFETRLSMEPDVNLAIFAFGGPGDVRLTVHEEDLSPVPVGHSRVTFVNAVTEYPRVLVTKDANNNPIEGVSALGPRQIGNPVLIEAGTYDFFWEVPGNDENDHFWVEINREVQLEAGFSYLYLFTGRGLDATPVVLGDRVEVDEMLIVDTGPLPTPSQPTNLQVVNMLLDRPTIDMLIDDIVLVMEQPWGQISSSIIIPDGQHTMMVRISGQEVAAGGDVLDFIAAVDYTLYVYGESDDIRFLLLQNISGIADSSHAFLRLVNLSQESESMLDLSYSRPGALEFVVPPSAATGGGQDDPATEEPVVDAIPFREPLRIQAIKLFQDVGFQSASPMGSVEAEVLGFYIIDVDVDQVAAKVLEYPLEAGVQYDVVALQAENTQFIEAFVVPYTAP